MHQQRSAFLGVLAAVAVITAAAAPPTLESARKSKRT